jgi:hypothetical protein
MSSPGPASEKITYKKHISWVCFKTQLIEAVPKLIDYALNAHGFGTGLSRRLLEKTS